MKYRLLIQERTHNNCSQYALSPAIIKDEFMQIVKNEGININKNAIDLGRD